MFCRNPFRVCALRLNPWCLHVDSGWSHFAFLCRSVWSICSRTSMYSIGCHHGGFLYSNSGEWVVSVCRYECSWHPPHWLQSFPLTILSQCTSITVSVAVSQCLCSEELADIETCTSGVLTDQNHFTLGLLKVTTSLGTHRICSLIGTGLRFHWVGLQSRNKHQVTGVLNLYLTSEWSQRKSCFVDAVL